MITKTLTPTQFANKCAELKAKEGIEITGNNGTVSKDGVQLAYNYDGATLDVIVNKTPPFMGKHVATELQTWLDS